MTSERLEGGFELDENVKRAFPITGTRAVHARHYGQSLWGQVAKIITILPDGVRQCYLLKSISKGSLGRCMIEGEYESLKAMHKVVPDFIPEPYDWGNYEKDNNVYFLLLEFREVGLQPPNPTQFTARLARLHEKSKSPTGKFGFHITTCHGTLTQVTDCWEDSWAELFNKQLRHMIELDIERQESWPEFHALCRLALDKLVPRLLLPLQASGRSIKPCLVHGDLWDDNTATDMDSSEPFAFDPCSFYAHNEYELGNWRAERRRLSDKVFSRNYKRQIAASEPKSEWDDRNALYSLRFDLGAALQTPGSRQREQVRGDMSNLLKKFCLPEYNAIVQQSTSVQKFLSPQFEIRSPLSDAGDSDSSEDIGEEEEVEEHMIA